MYNVAKLRQDEFPQSQNQVYLNHASISPLPQRTKWKMQWVTEQLANNPTQFFMTQGMAMVELFKNTAAQYINAQHPEEIVPVASTSSGLHAIAQAIDWQQGDNVLFCEVEFPSNAFPWMQVERYGVEVRAVTAVNGGLTLDQLKQRVDAQTRLVAVSAVQFLSGHRADLNAIGQFCHEHNILFVVDAIQAIGHIPFDVQAMHIDVLAAGGQKSLLASPGCGFMYVHGKLAEQLNPRTIGPNATQEFLHWLDYDLTPLPKAQRFWAGTPNMSGMFAVIESLNLINQLDVACIDEHVRGLTAVAAQHISQLGYELVTPVHTPEYGPICTFRVPKSAEEVDAMVANFAQHGVTLGKHLDAESNQHIRISFHCYNTQEDVTQFAEILKSLY